MFEKIAFLTLGWLLGLLAPVIVDAIKRRRENALGRDAILSELREVGGLLAVAAYGARMHRGKADKAFLQWLTTDLERHAVSEQLSAMIPNLRQQLSWSDQDIATGSKLFAGAEGVGAVLQRYPVPLLDARVSAVWTFDTSFQRGLLAVRQNMHFLDDLVERTRRYHDMTFVALDSANHARVIENIDQAYDLYAERAIRTVNLIRGIAP
jgi:hypothetical protein